MLLLLFLCLDPFHWKFPRSSPRQARSPPRRSPPSQRHSRSPVRKPFRTRDLAREVNHRTYDPTNWEVKQGQEQRISL
ncbi:hypothetical protein IHE45_02G025400 [Dioscorea alata]|uniref:Uncharacterized protein n=1 Tax=Dioscorea alata TaxID=55571 RepID=A0ACB7WPU0_DIOAL|nr:hypothetical protein IHE45_02G025400 [Dioscorea alata]